MNLNKFFFFLIFKIYNLKIKSVEKESLESHLEYNDLENDKEELF
jgi:hypothetical protein